MSGGQLPNFILELQVSLWEEVTIRYLDANAFKGGGIRSSLLARYNVDDKIYVDRHNRNLTQLQLLLYKGSANFSASY